MKSCPFGCSPPNCVRAAPEVLERLQKCVFVCPNKVRGCTQDIPYSEMAQHEQTCEFRVLREPKILASYENFDESKLYSQEELLSVIRSLQYKVKLQDEEIKELKEKLLKDQDLKMEEQDGLHKLEQNVNTQLDLDLLTSSQQSESVGFFGAQHFSNIKKLLPDFKDFYEHNGWRMRSNLGFLQVYTKQSDEEGCLHILARSEFNHKASDIGNEIANQNIFIQDDPNVVATEVLQKVSDNINVFCVKFNRFLVAEQSDVVFLCQKIENPVDSEDNTVAFPMLSISHYKKKPEEGTERLEVKLGGWVLKSLGATKTLVNIFFNMKFPLSAIPEELAGKHTKVLSSMIRTLDSACHKTYANHRLSSQIFDKTLMMSKEETKSNDFASRQNLEEEKRGNQEDIYDIMNSKESFPKLEYPDDIKEIDPSTLQEEHKQYIMGARSRLHELIDLINSDEWNYVKTKGKTRIYVKKSERGLVCIKGETIFPFDAELIVSYLMRVDRRHEYDKFTDHANIIQELPRRTFLVYAKIKQILVVASRDITFTSQIITSKKQG